MTAPLPNNDNIRMNPIRQQSTQIYPPQVAIKRSKSDLRGTLSKMLLVLLIVPYYIVLGLAWGIFGFVVFLLNFGVLCASAVLGGVIEMVLGNLILRSAHLSHYTSDTWACRIGAIGGGVLLICLFPFSLFAVADPESSASELRRIPVRITYFCIAVALGAASGAIGCSVLVKHHVELPGDMDVLHAARAGAFGAAILGPGFLIATIVIESTVVGVLMLPLLLKIEYAFVRARENISDGTSSAYSCLCVATRGGGDGDSVYGNNWV